MAPWLTHDFEIDLHDVCTSNAEELYNIGYQSTGVELMLNPDQAPSVLKYQPQVNNKRYT